jgi:hypothetical protein
LEETSPLDSKFVPLADTNPPKTSAGIIMMVIGGGIVCGLVILAGWWLFSAKSQTQSVVPQQVPQQIVQQPEALSVTPPEPENVPSQAVSIKPLKLPADISALPKLTDQAPESTSVKIPEPSVSVIEQREVLPVGKITAVAKQATESAIHLPETPSSEIIEQTPPEKVTAAITRPPEVSIKTKAIDIPLLNDPEMKLQAVTWSKDPQKRIAVINNRILRQGEKVSGYHIDMINQDDVILSDGRERWKLLFRIN